MINLGLCQQPVSKEISFDPTIANKSSGLSEWETFNFGIEESK